MAKYYIKLASVEASAIQPPHTLDDAFAHFKKNPPPLPSKSDDPMIHMGYYEPAGDEEMYSFFDALFMVKGPESIDFYLYKESAPPVTSKPAPPQSAA